MLVKEVFEDIFTGFNLTNSIGSEKNLDDIYFIQKDSIQYTNIIINKLVKKRITTSIKNKYYMKDRDIIVSLKKPYKVGTYKYHTDKKIIIPNNFLVLRGINRNLYSYIFLVNYLEKIGISKYVKENNIEKDLTVEDIKNIELPNITKKEQMKISELMNLINDRSAIYSTILENDDQIIRYALNNIVGGSDDK